MEDDLLEAWLADDEIEINLKTPAEAAGRLLALVTVARRGFLEQRPDLGKDDTPETERFDLRAWLAEERLLDALWPHELEMIDTPIGELDPGDTAAATWSIEGATALAWALTLLPAIPPYDQATDAKVVLDIIPAPWSRTTEFRAAATLRDEEEIARAREIGELWNDRADTYWWEVDAAELGEGPSAVGGIDVLKDLRESVIETAAQAHEAGYIAKPIAGDFPVRDQAYRDLIVTEVEELDAIALHRSLALNWLCGLTND